MKTISVMEDTQHDTASFLEKLGVIEGVEEKLQTSIAFMKNALAQEGQPNFKGFWEVRKHCLPIFKEMSQSPTRVKLWSDYIELTREGRRLKNLMDQETAFAVEQIELAISSLEEEIKTYQTDPEVALENTPPISFPKESKFLNSRFPFYEKFQKQLNILNVFASRINALRKELIRTEMRVKQKNKFFQRLSELGDQVFPVRKEHIQEISQNFLQDVERFVEANFSEKNFSHEQVRRSVFYFREEIKSLQLIAKQLTLNTHAFSTTRQLLSECWDKLKGMEKELKKEFAAQKQKSSGNVDQVLSRIQNLSEGYARGERSVSEAYEEISEISHWMRELELTRKDVQTLKEALQIAREPLDSKVKEEEEAKKQKAFEFEKARQQKAEELKQQLETLIGHAQTTDPDTLSEELEEYRKNFLSTSLSKTERQTIERTLKEIRDLIAKKKEEALLALPEGDRAVLDHLKEILIERQQRRKETKTQIEEYRKIIGGSGLDFEKAMRYNELMAEEKDNLSKIDEGISEIEQKIRTLTNNR